MNQFTYRIEANVDLIVLMNNGAVITTIPTVTEAVALQKVIQDAAFDLKDHLRRKEKKNGKGTNH